MDRRRAIMAELAAASAEVLGLLGSGAITLANGATAEQAAEATAIFDRLERESDRADVVVGHWKRIDDENEQSDLLPAQHECLEHGAALLETVAYDLRHQHANWRPGDPMPPKWGDNTDAKNTHEDLCKTAASLFAVADEIREMLALQTITAAAWPMHKPLIRALA